jgi:hypothetical protein
MTRYFTIYMTNGGRLTVRQSRELARAMDTFSAVASGQHGAPTIWALMVEFHPASKRTKILKVHGAFV